MRRSWEEEQLGRKEVREEPWGDLAGGLPGGGNSACKGREAGPCLAWRPVWLEQSEGERGRRGGQGGDGQVVQGLVGQEDLGFHPEGGGSPGGLRSERRPDGALTGALWLPWGD